MSDDLFSAHQEDTTKPVAKTAMSQRLAPGGGGGGCWLGGPKTDSSHNFEKHKATPSIEAELYGYDLFGEPAVPPSSGPLADRFVVPPFTVLNAGEGFWRERKRAWIGLGIKSEVGRNVEIYNTPKWLRQKKASCLTGTSIFDPVLCELVYRWFCPEGGQVLDPFAGGSVRGIVAHKMGLRYWGSELRAEQVAANKEQARAICGDAPVNDGAPGPTWVVGDAMDAVPAAPRADLVFTCPPYGDLERYSDDPADLSTMEFHTFIAAYRRIILRSAERLRPNRFAAIVVGNYRDKRTGFYRDFVGETVRAFEAVGMGYYNEAILVTSRGSLPIRITKQFEAGRKLGKTHQNLLVFVKGDAKVATAACWEDNVRRP